MAETPKTPKRYGKPIPGRPVRKQPGGQWTAALTNEKYQTILGELVSYWVQIEERMIEFLRMLLGSHAPARQIFRAITAQNVRLNVMRALLERSRLNKDKSGEYDAIISEFASLNDRRNIYVHCLWSTHESGRVFLAESSIDDGHWFEQREVPFEELANVVIRMGNLWRRIMILQYPDQAGRFSMRPLLEIPPPPPDEETP